MTTPPATAPMAELRTESWDALGTTAVLRVCASDSAPMRTAVEREVDAIDVAASRFRPDSELSRLNAAGGSRTSISPLFLEALKAAIRGASIQRFTTACSPPATTATGTSSRRRRASSPPHPRAAR
jgi:FAD:protein FMN transferase